MYLSDAANKHIYQAHLAINPLSYFFSIYFLPSSNSIMAMPKAAGKKKCLAGTSVVPWTTCNCGIYSYKIATQSANAIARNKYRFCVFLNAGIYSNDVYGLLLG